MEYQLKKEQILSSVQYSNLLSFNLVQNKLERNFKSIVEALLLNQTKTDDLISKTDQLEDKVNGESKKSSNDIQGIKKMLKLFNDRLSKLQNSAPSTSLPSESNMERLPSSKKVQESEKEGTQKQVPSLSAPVFNQDNKEDRQINEKQLSDIKHQISRIKDKLPTVQLLEDQLEAMKREFTALKGELITFGKSNNSMRRQSIGNNLSTNNLKRDSVRNGSKQSILARSSSNVVLPNDIRNKENEPNEAVDKENVINRIDFGGSKKDISNSKMDVNEGRQALNYDKQIEGLHVQVNTLNLCYEEVKALVEDLRKRDAKHHATLIEVEDKQKRMQDQVRKDSQAFEKKLKVIQVGLLNTPSVPSKESENADMKDKKEDTNIEGQQKEKKSPKKNEKNSIGGVRQDITINFKDQINDRLSKIQNSLQGFVTETEFNRFKTETRDKSEQLEKKHDKFEHEMEEELKKIYDMFINKDIQMNRLGQQILANTDIIKENNAQAERKHNIAMARIEELKKGLQNLREDVQFYQSLNAENKEKKPAEGQNGEMNEAANKQKMVDGKAIEDLKRYFNNKMHDQRAYLVGLVRDLEKKQNAGHNINQQIANIWDKLNELGVFLNKKADGEDIKKSLIYLEKKINKLAAQLMKTEDNTEDARVAKTSWFCLSCDKNLLGYQGKIGRHVVWDQVPLKGTLKSTIQKKGLPSLKGSK